MAKAVAVVAAAVIVGAPLPAAAQTVIPLPPFTQCPAVGSSPSCKVLLVVEPGGSITVYSDDSVGDYDGGDDTLVGIWNNSRSSVNAITVSGPGSDLGDFDGDGLCTYIACTWNAPTGYEGPDNSFTTSATTFDVAEVDLLHGGLQPGASTYFSLEGTLTSAVLTARQGHLGIGRYVALGDSYSSGEGAIDSGGNAAYVAGSDTAGDKCHRSEHAYAYLLKQSEGVADSDFTFAACSGALLQNLTIQGQYGEAPQLDAIAAKGHSDPNVGLVTLSIGGNDYGFAHALSSCATGFGNWHTPSGCIATSATGAVTGAKILTQGQTLLYNASIGTYSPCNASCQTQAVELHKLGLPLSVVQEPSLSGTIQEIHRRAPDAKIRVLLYPRLFPSNPPAKCDVGSFAALAVTHTYSLVQTEMSEFNTLGADLDQVIGMQVADARGHGIDVATADPNAAFEGHRICDAQEQWLNGLYWDAAARIVSSYSSGSFHPRAVGQAEFATTLQATL